MAIDWKIEKSESTTEQVSSDGRWHMSSKIASDGPKRYYLTNYDLLGGVGSFGASQAECWRSFVEKCDIYAKRLALVRKEAAALAEELTQKEQQ